VSNFEKAYVDKDNVVRWKSNDHVPFNDVLLDLLVDGLISQQQFINSKHQRIAEESSWLTAYRKEQENHVPDAEELFEMRAAFGEGATVVNIFTGGVTQI
jgi:hypothetical protein